MFNEDKNEEKTNKYVSVFSRTKGIIYDIYLTNEITHSSYEYNDLLLTLRRCHEEDDIQIYINSGGGALPTTFQIINAMGQCKAPITTILDGNAHSAASLLFLSGNAFVFSDSSAMLCHYFTTGIHGKGHEVSDYITFAEEHYKQLFKNIYNHFLTEKELEEMFTGKDFWFNYKQIEKRLKVKSGFNKKSAPKKKTVRKTTVGKSTVRKTTKKNP